MLFSRLHSYWVMTKPRAMLVVLVTAAAGYLIAMGSDSVWTILAHLLIGAGLSGGGSIVLNQFIERDHDGKMERTRNRPLPSGAVRPIEALIYGILLAVVGTAWLGVFVNGVTAWLAGISVVSYVLAYTPLKRITTLNTAVGAVPGAIPPMMGWTAATGTIGLEAWVLFAILFVWQFPHFLAIGWLYREDYSRAGYAMLPCRDPEGASTGRQVVLNAACLIVLSLAPVAFRFAGPAYAVAALILGLGLLLVGIAFARRPSDRAAWWLLKSSVVHISLLMTFLVIGRFV